MCVHQCDSALKRYQCGAAGMTNRSAVTQLVIRIRGHIKGKSAPEDKLVRGVHHVSVWAGTSNSGKRSKATRNVRKAQKRRETAAEGGQKGGKCAKGVKDGKGKSKSVVAGKDKTKYKAKGNGKQASNGAFTSKGNAKGASKCCASRYFVKRESHDSSGE